MLKNRSIAVVVPAHNEEKLILRTIREMPDFVDHIIVVDDASTDKTPQLVTEEIKNNSKLHFIRHEKNRGVGGSISSGYVWCRDNNADVAVVMAGDAQMDPKDLPDLLEPILNDRADYTKGNRLVTGEAWKKIPKVRYIGNSMLTFLTKIASGYWQVTDSQSGYTALNKKALHRLPIEDIYPRYGMPNDFLVTLNIYDMRVRDVPVRPVYGIGEKSGIRTSILFTLSFLMLRLFIKRMFQKYIVRDFHPLVLFYTFGFLLLLVDMPLIFRLFYMWQTTGIIPAINSLAILFCTLLGFQSLLFAMLFDMEANRDLKG